VVDWKHGSGPATDVSERRKGGDMSVSGGVVAALVVVALSVAVFVVLRSRRASNSAVGTVLFPNTTPIPLGGHAVVRFAGSPVRAMLVCHEVVPGAVGSTVTEVFTVDCPVRMVAHEPAPEAAIRVDIPLSVWPTTTFADHRVDWSLVIETPSDSVQCPVQVAPVVARTVLQGEVNP